MNQVISKQFLTLTLLMISSMVIGFTESEAANNYKDIEKMDLMPLKQVDYLVLPDLNVNKALAKAAAEEANGIHKFAEAYNLYTDTKQNGTWEFTEEGDSVWRMMITSPGSLHLNFGFTKYQMPEDGELVIYTPKGEDFIGPFSSKDNAAHGELWTPIVAGDTAIIQVTVPSDKVDELKLEVGTVNQGFTHLGGVAGEKSGSCNVDVICSQGDQWRSQIAAVGAYTISGTDTCSGSLINNTANDQTPYFLTANHCRVTSANDQAVVIYWNYENSVCRAPGSTASGGAGNGTRTQFNSGVIWRASYSQSDFTLVELEEPVDLAYNLYYAGWDRRQMAPSSAVGIHHPQVEEKRISFENDPLSITDYGPSPLGVLNFLQVTDWDLGTTEGGSSGSPLFSPEKRIIGQLFGGFAACGNNSADWYGGIFASWEGGGTPTTRLKDWLDPLNTGALTLDGIQSVPPTLNIASISAINDSVGGDGDQLLEPGESAVSFAITLENNFPSTATNVQVTLSSSVDGLTFDNAQSTFPTMTAGASQTSNSQFVVSYDQFAECLQEFPLIATITGTNNSQPVELTRQVTLSGPTTCNVVPALSFDIIKLDDSATNNNEIVEPGEMGINILSTLSNSGAPLVNANVSFSVVDGPLTVNPVSQMISVASGGSSLVNGLTFNVNPGAPCPSTAHLLVEFNDGNINFEFPIEVKIGQAINLQTTSQSPNITYGDVGLQRIVERNFNVNAEGNVLDVNIELDIDHTYVSDNVFSVTSPMGTQVILFQEHGGNDDQGFSNVLFDDDASESIINAIPPYNGAYSPTESLSAFIGEPINGTWTITIVDEADLDEGTINSIQFRLLYEFEDCPAISSNPELWIIQ